MSDLIIERRDVLGSKVKIRLNDKFFEIVKSTLGLNREIIRIGYDKFVHKPESHIYFYNDTQRVSVVYTEDIELDYIQISDNNGVSINCSSNDHCEGLFGQIENRIRVVNNH